VEVDETFFAKDALFVNAEHGRCLEVTIDRAVPEDLFHHFLLGGIAPASTDEVRFLYFGNGLAAFVVLAVVALGAVYVGRALFGDQVAVFGEEDVEVGPATITPLVHIITGHQLLRRKHGGLLSVFDL